MGNCSIQVHQYVHSYIQYKTLRRKMTKSSSSQIRVTDPDTLRNFTVNTNIKSITVFFLYNELYIKYVALRYFVTFFLINSNNRAKM